MSPTPEELLRQRAWLRRLAGRLVRDAADADDIVQEAYARALAHPPRDAARVRGWFARVVLNLVRQRARTRARRRTREARAARPEGLAATADVVVRAETQRRVACAVMDVPEPFRTALLLRYFEDLPPREVARRLAVPVATVHSRLRRGRRLLRARLDRAAGGDGRAWALGLLPLLPRPSATGTLWLGGALTMTNKKVLAAAATALVAAVCLWAVPRSATPRHRASNARAPAARTAAAPTAPAVDARPGARALEGVVIGPSGNPVAGARVEVVPPPAAERPRGPAPGATVASQWRRATAARTVRHATQTGSDGRFVLAASAPDDALFVRAAGFLPRRVSARRFHGVVRLERARATRGRVIDEEDRPVPGARVHLVLGWHGPDPVRVAVADTDAAGAFAFADAGTHVVVSHPGHVGQVAPVAGEDTVVRLDRPRALEGVVVTRAGRAPVAGATVYLRLDPTRFAVTDTRGAFRIEHGVPGVGLRAPITLVVDAGPHGNAIVPDVSLVAGEPVTVVLGGARTVDGSVADGEGAPVPGVRVFAIQDDRVWRAARTGPDGAFRIEHLDATEAVTFRIDPWDPHWEQSNAADATIRVRRRRTVAGRVLAPDGRPVAGAAVDVARTSDRRFGWIPRAAAPVTTDTAGRFRLGGVTRDEVEVRASAPGFVAAGATVGAEDGEIVIRLRAGGAIAGRVLLPHGAPAVGVAVKLHGAGIGRPHAARRTDAEGAYRFDAVPPATWTLAVDAGAAYLRVERPVDVGVAPDVVLESGHAIHGRVVDDAGTPVRRATVAVLIRPKHDEVARVETDSGGRYAVGGLAAGSYVVVAACHTYQTRTVKTDVPRVEPVDVVLDRGRSIRGTVHDPDGVPIAGATVRAARTHGDGPGGAGVGQTDTNGRFEIRALSDGVFTLRLRDAGDFAVAPLTDVRAGAVVRLHASRGRYVTGRVVDADGAPVWARVKVSDGAEARVERDGRYRAGPVLAETVTLVAHVHGKRGSVVARAGDDGVTIRFGDGETLAGHAETPGPLRFVLQGADLPPFFAQPGPDGSFRLDGLPSGAYEAACYDETASAWVPLGQVTAGQLALRLEVRSGR